VITITGLGDHDPPEWLITITGLRRHGVIGDPTLGDAILDRIAHAAYRIDLDGESLRKPLDGAET
jgi:hypothetical protein